MGCSSSSATSATRSPEEIEQCFHEDYILDAKLTWGVDSQVRMARKKAPGDASTEGENDSSARFDCAVKIVRLSQPTSKSRRRFEKSMAEEVKICTVVGRHPNCVGLQETFFGKEFGYMVMDECKRGLLHHLESLEELTESSLGTVLVQMLNGIAYCHSVGIVHRNIKPEKFVVGVNGANGEEVVRLGDFGFCAMLPKQGCLKNVSGTAPFMCPEMLTFQGYDEKADVWSFGVIGYLLLFGHFPYATQGQCARADCMKDAILEGVPPSFDPVSGPNEPVENLARSHAAVAFVKSLLQPKPELRPSANDSLGAAWMTAAWQHRRANDTDLPSLRPMLHAATDQGAFGFDEFIISWHDASDGLLDGMQVRAHGRSLPSTTCRPSSLPMHRTGMNASACSRCGARWTNAQIPLEEASTCAGSSELGSPRSFVSARSSSSW